MKSVLANGKRCSHWISEVGHRKHCIATRVEGAEEAGVTVGDGGMAVLPPRAEGGGVLKLLGAPPAETIRSLYT